MSEKNLSTISLSVLDLATILEGHTPADTFRNSLELARHVEALGYKRYWLAEHHNMPSIASSAPPVLIGYIAGGTSTIRVGSGGIMLPNHAPLVVAEQFGTLASLYPGRIDLGLGRAPGTDQTTAFALRRERMRASYDFPENIEELRIYLSDENGDGRVRAIPGEGLDIPIWILGSSTESAYLAARLGMPYAFASHFAPAQLHEALYLYRQHFRPSAELQEPYALACVNVVAADTDEEANYIATSLRQFVLGIIRGHRKPLPRPVESMEGLWSPYEEAAVLQMGKFAFVGSPATVEKNLQTFLDATQVDELMVVSHIYDHNARLRSYEILAELKTRQVSPSLVNT